MPPHFLNQTSKSNQRERILLGLVDLGLILAILVVPMMLGGNHATGRLMLVCSASLAGTAWAARQAIRQEPFFPGTWAIVILGIGLLIPIVQLIPLPEPLLNFLSPHLAEILPLWQNHPDQIVQLGSWRCLSVTPAETQAGLVIFAAYALLFIVVAGRVQTIKDLQRLLQWCGISVLVVALLGFIQHFLGNGKFFWFYEHPYCDASVYLSGPFVNRNHFAQFMALGIGPILIWVVGQTASKTPRREKRSKVKRVSHTSSHSQAFTHASEATTSHRRLRTDQREHHHRTHHSKSSNATKAGQFLLPMTAGLVIFACLLSLSRGGSMAMLLAIGICCTISLSVPGASRRMLTAMLLAGVILGGALMTFGYNKICDRLGSLTSGKVELMDVKVGRRAIWKTDLQAASYFPIFGTGVGSHREVYPIFFDYVHHDYREFTHAENGYIQTLLETGGAGAALLLSAIGLVGFWCIKGIRQSHSDQLRLCLAAISAAIAASLFHSMTDFFWYIPGCATITVIMAACAFCAYRLAKKEASREATLEQNDRSTKNSAKNSAKTFHKPRSKAIQPVFAWTTVGAIALISTLMVQERLGPAQAQPYWDAFLCADEASEYNTLVLDDLQPEQLQNAKLFYTAQIERLRNVVRLQPHHARAHRSLALNCLKLFDVYQVASTNPMSLTHISDAAISSDFESQAALLEWLHRAFGQHVSLLKLAQHHAQCSIKECPTIDWSYVFLTELCFLDQYSFEQKKQLVNQALLVRPRSGQSVLGLARHALISGDIQQWAELSRRVYDINLDMRKLVLRDLLDNTQTDMLPVMIAIAIDQFKPDHKAAVYMLSRCQKRIPDIQLVELRRYCANQALANLEDCTPSEEASRRLTAAIQYQELGEPGVALEQLHIAYNCDPNHFGVRKRLGMYLLDQGFPKEAYKHFEWCFRRKPNKWFEKMRKKAYFDANLDVQARSEDNKGLTR